VRPTFASSTLFEQGEVLDRVAERVGFIDMTAATKAGLETWILNQAEENLLPEILVLEEIEKCDKDNLMALGSIMASGYIMRTNARISRVRHEVRSLIWATCNDEEALRAFRRGFIFDRFANQLYCPLPDRETLYAILLDKVKKIPRGNPLWADKALLLAD
jgi:MoxR-like ATPase